MSIQTICNNCGSKFKAPEKAIGRKAKCPKCKYSLVITDHSIKKVTSVPKTNATQVAVRNTISVMCKNCGSKFKAPENAIGKKAKCPKCKYSLVIADHSIRNDMLVPQTNVNQVAVCSTISVMCKNCGSKFKAPENAIGRKAKCPKCKYLLVIADDSIKNDMLVPQTNTNQVAVYQPTPDKKQCPFCSEEVLSSAKKCKHCGELLDFALRTAEQALKSVDKQSTTVFMNSATSAAATNVTGNEKVISGDKKKNTAALLAIFLGGFGAHKFYHGNWGLGILYIVFCWTSISGFIGLIEGIIYLSMDEATYNLKYNSR
ncbi:NINE protein [Desulfococcaceae bacterium HSG7]|nr:NINE protein [Desulfococcaceae bacterium HSG7]